MKRLRLQLVYRLAATALLIGRVDPRDDEWSFDALSKPKTRSNDQDKEPGSDSSPIKRLDDLVVDVFDSLGEKGAARALREYRREVGIPLK